jgi:hypothetical protein
VRCLRLPAWQLPCPTIPTGSRPRWGFPRQILAHTSTQQMPFPYLAAQTNSYKSIRLCKCALPKLAICSNQVDSGWENMHPCRKAEDIANIPPPADIPDDAHVA